MSTLGMMVGRFIGPLLGKRAEILGGIVLIGIGSQILWAISPVKLTLRAASSGSEIGLAAKSSADAARPTLRLCPPRERRHLQQACASLPVRIIGYASCC
jgi:hypothetical protein